MIVAFSALAGRDLVFEGRGIAHSFDRRRNRLLRQRGPAEIGVQYGAGQIEDPALRGLHLAGERPCALLGYRLDRGRDTTVAPLRQRPPDRVDNQRSSISRDQVDGPLGAQYPVDRRQPPPTPASLRGHFAAIGSGRTSAAPSSKRTRGSLPLRSAIRPMSAAP